MHITIDNTIDNTISINSNIIPITSKCPLRLMTGSENKEIIKSTIVAIDPDK